MVFLWLQNRRRFAGMIYWVVNYALQLTAILLIILRGTIPDWISIVASNTFAITGVLLALLGLEKFTGITIQKPLNYMLVVVFAILQALFTFHHNDLALRDLIISITTLIFFIQCSLHLLYSVSQNTRKITMGVGMVFIVYSVVSITRIIEYFAGTHSSNDFLNPDEFEKFVLLSYQILFILLTFALALMFNKKLLVSIATEEEKFSRAFHNSPYASLITRVRDGEILEINTSFTALTGYGRDEASGKTTLELGLWNDAEDRLRIIKESANSNKVSEQELVFRKKSGELIITLYSAEIININNEICLLASVNDITERKKGEDALKESNRKISTLINNLRGVAYQCANDSDWTMSFISEGIYELTGYPASDFINNRIRSYCSIIEPGDKASIMETIQKAVAAGVPYTLEYRILTTGSEKKWVWERGRGVYEEGRLVALEGFITDITERKLTEEEARKLNDDLEERVAQRTRELTDTATQLKTVNSELEAFSYSVSHDLRAPLRAINGYARILRDDYNSVLDKEGQRLLKIIGDNSKKMGNLINDLLSFSRFGRKEMANSEIDMFTTAKRVFKELAVESPKSRVGLQIEKIPGIQGDQTMVQQIWVNLLSNALKFTAPREDGRIEIGSFAEDSQTTYYVKDNGVGFDMEYSDKLFGVFQRLHSEKEFEGTGVGLAIVKRIVLRMGGRIWAEGKINEGATFYFSLPSQIN
jgi:PAS domain S-box-containing protein